MHKVFRKLLKEATGISEFIIAINLDIRGFSTFSKKVESPDVAMFIKRVYMKIIDHYFRKASFFKPTGDGLLIIVPFTEKKLHKTAKDVIDICLRILKNFGNFCTNDPMVNFEVPRMIGIGICRGTACRLLSGSTTLDYSGRVLNLASRLMDIARPSGIVFDDDFGIDLLSESQVKLFKKDTIFIKGIAERNPINIWYTKDSTSISPLSKQPIDKIKWNTDVNRLTLKEIKESTDRFWYDLQTEPLDPNEIKIKISYPGIRKGRKAKGYISFFQFSNFEYILEAGRPKVKVEFDTLQKRLKTLGVKDTWDITIEIIYPGI